MKKIALILALMTLLYQKEAKSQVIKVTTTEGSYNILREYFQHHIHYSAIARENDVAGEMIVSFVIDKDQKLTDIKFIKPLMAYCDSEVVQKIRDYNANKKGIQLKPQQYTVVVNFILIRTKDEKGTRDTLNKIALKKLDTDTSLQVKIIGQPIAFKRDIIIDAVTIKSANH